MILYVGLGAGLIWLLGLTWIVWKTKSHYHTLVKRTGRESIEGILNALLTYSDHFKKDLATIKSEVENVKEKAQLHLHKTGIVHFSPFGKRGGEQSFVLCLLDQRNNGIVINFIYTFEGLRVYTKKIVNGKGKEHELTKEEREAMEKAS